MKRKRIEELDILKGIAIILMVVGHTGIHCTRFIFLFHMALFVIASGCTYNSRSSDNLSNVLKYIFKKVKRLWLPYFAWNSLLYLLYNWLIKINITTDNPELLDYTASIKIMNINYVYKYLNAQQILHRIAALATFQGACHPIGGALWFMGLLFFISVGYVGIDWLIKKIFHRDTMIFQLIVSVVLLAIGYYFHLQYRPLRGMARVASSYHLFYFGVVFSRYRYKTEHGKKGQYLFAFLLSLGVLLAFTAAKITINISYNKYPNPAFFFVASLAGWGLCYTLAYFMKDTFLKVPMIEIGMRTIWITTFHYAFFKLVTALIVKIYHLPDFCLAAFPHMYGDRGLWWLAYAIVGIAGPFLLWRIYYAVIEGIRNKGG